MRKSGRILVADDEKPQREILVSSLEKRGYEVCGAGDLGTALKLFEQGLQDQNPFNTVVTDLRMPTDKEGLELLMQVHGMMELQVWIQ